MAGASKGCGRLQDSHRSLRCQLIRACRAQVRVQFSGILCFNRQEVLKLLPEKRKSEDSTVRGSECRPWYPSLEGPSEPVWASGPNHWAAAEHCHPSPIRAQRVPRGWDTMAGGLRWFIRPGGEP